MHLHAVHIVIVWLGVRYGRKPCQPILKEEDPQRVDAQQKHVKPEIELHFVDQQRLLDVVLDHTVH